jgi:energy-coupling factor transport system permease protein
MSRRGSTADGGGLVPVFRPGASALHSARAGVATTYCAAFALVAMLFTNPVILSAVLCGIVAAGIAAGVGRELARTARLAVPLALLVTLVNPLVYREGDTLLVRGGDFLGRRMDITLEALAAGGLAGLRVLALALAFGLFSAAVDPDDVLRLFRRISFRSALTTSLATRLIPILARDATRMSDAARCRPEPPGRGAVARAALAGALERAIDVAAALEVRGYSRARRPARRRVSWSRHDVRIGIAAVVIAAAGVAAAVAGIGAVEPYPRVEIALGPPELAAACVIVLAAVAPFAVPGARLGVARA